MVQVWAVSMVKDEEDVAYHVLMHMAGEGFDGMIVADNGSSDATHSELERAKADLASSSKEEEARCQIEIIDDPEVGYYQSRKMSALADEAAARGATWIVPFDADEIWYAPDRVATVLRGQPKAVGVVTATLHNHYRTGLDDEVPNPFQAMVWRHLDVGVLPKVAFRYQPGCVVLQGNHGVSGIDGRTEGGLEIRHFPYRSWEQFERKAVNGAAAYAATDLAEYEGAHWRGYGQILERHGSEALREVYEQYFQFLSPVDENMVRDPAPFRRWG